MADREIRVSRCGPGQVPSAAEVELLYYAATCGRPLRESRAMAAGYARLYAALLRRPDLEAVAARGLVAASSPGSPTGTAGGGPSRPMTGRPSSRNAWAGRPACWTARTPCTCSPSTRGTAGQAWLQLLQTLVSATKTGAWLITPDEPTPAMALYQQEGWEPIGHGPDSCDARPGLVLTHP